MTIEHFLGNTEVLDEVLATTAMEAIRCMHCNDESQKPGQTHVHDLAYPSMDPLMRAQASPFKFSSILKATLERERKNRGWCNKCRRYQNLGYRKSITHLPYVLLLNAALTNPIMRALWEAPGWLPSEIGISIRNRAVHCFEGVDLQTQIRNRFP